MNDGGGGKDVVDSGEDAPDVCPGVLVTRRAPSGPAGRDKVRWAGSDGPPSRGEVCNVEGWPKTGAAGAGLAVLGVSAPGAKILPQTSSSQFVSPCNTVSALTVAPFALATKLSKLTGPAFIEGRGDPLG